MKNELPSTLKAFRYQQHRWSCGPANLFRKMAMEIITNKVCCFLHSLRIFCFLNFFKLFLCWSLFVLQCIAESVYVEEVLRGLQFFLCSKDRRSYCYICVLLCCSAGNSLGSWSGSTQVGCCLHSFYHYPSQCCWNSKVSLSHSMFFCLGNKFHNVLHHFWTDLLTCPN